MNDFPNYFPERTVQYVTYIKGSMADALQDVFSNHPDELLSKTLVTVEYPKTQAEFPAVVVRFFERDIMNAGIGHEETLVVEGETVASNEVAVTVAQGQAARVWWTPLKGATGYRVYRGDGSGLQNTYFETKSANFLDRGNGIAATEVNLPDENTTDLEPPEIKGIATDMGYLPAGTYYYKVTAIKPGGAWKFQHYFYTGDIEFAIYALSSVDRDLVRDTIVQTIAMGQLEGWTNRFLDRIYPDPETGAFPESYLHFISPNTDTIQGFGETQQPVPWGDEDNMLYMASYRLGMMGEIYSLPPDIPFELVREVFDYPWIENVEDVPQGDPNNDNPWQTFS